MQTPRDDPEKDQSLEEAIAGLDATATTQGDSLEPAAMDVDPDPEAIDAVMQMLVESGWMFESETADAQPVTDAFTVTPAQPRTEAIHSERPRPASTGSIQQSSGSALQVAPRVRPSFMDDIELLLNPRVGRGRQREQLIHLRTVVQKLENELHRLQQTALIRSSVSCDAASSVGIDLHSEVGSASVWRQVAERQYEERRRVEQENTRLRASLQTQIEVARRLEKLLKRHPPQDMP